MSTSSEKVLNGLEFRDEMVLYENKPYIAPSPRLTLVLNGRPVGHLAYDVLEGEAKIFGAKLFDNIEPESRASTLEALVKELAVRTGTTRPLLSIRKSRWPEADLWPLLKAKNLVEIPHEAEST